MPPNRLRVDPFLAAIIMAAALGSFLPVRGNGVDVLDRIIQVAIAALFLLHGVKLVPKQALAALSHWRLHLTILTCTYVVFPLVGLSLHLIVPTVISPQLYAGILYVCLVPSTVQSSIAFTSVAKGNVAGAIVAASASNILGVVVTPLLCWALMSTTGRATVSPSAIIDICAQILLPFILGQASRPLAAGFVKRHPGLTLVDQGSIVLVVYAAFSAGAREHMWAMISGLDIVMVILVCLAILAFMLRFTWTTARRLGFDRADLIAIQFCGTKKSLASGLPMATVLFAGQPLGLLIIPLMVFHQAQLLACSVLSGRYARQVSG